MAPNPVNCLVPTCDYKTPATLPNYDAVYRDLDLHTKYAHHDLQVAPPQHEMVNEMVAHRLVRGLNDVEMQEQIMGHAATNSDLDLAGIIKFLEVKETGKRSSGLITAAATGGLNKLS